MRIFNLDREPQKARRAKARKLRKFNALPKAKEIKRVGRRRGRIIPPQYKLGRRDD